MKENDKRKEKVRISDFYQGAYLLIIGAKVEGLEVVKELDKEICFITFTGCNIISKLNDYVNSQAIVDPLLYQKALNRVRDIVHKAIDKARQENFKKGGLI